MWKFNMSQKNQDEEERKSQLHSGRDGRSEERKRGKKG